MTAGWVAATDWDGLPTLLNLATASQIQRKGEKTVVTWPGASGIGQYVNVREQPEELLRLLAER